MGCGLDRAAEPEASHFSAIDAILTQIFRCGLIAAVFVFVFVFLVADFSVALIEGGFAKKGRRQAGIVLASGVEGLIEAVAIAFARDLERGHHPTETLIIGKDCVD